MMNTIRSIRRPLINSLPTVDINSEMSEDMVASVDVVGNGPSLLSVDPAKLAMQWTDPRVGLGLRKHHRSHLGNEYSLMHDVKSAFMDNKLNKMDGIKDILEPFKEYDSVFKMIGGYEKRNAYCDSPSSILRKRKKTISDKQIQHPLPVEAVGEDNLIVEGEQQFEGSNISNEVKIA
ncbi:hypothetical protein Aduo_005272 [Ancylostoma duodenale]